MSETMQRLRGTGRTTRMLEHAKRMAGLGQTVYVIAVDARDARRLEMLIGAPELGINVMPGLSAEEWDRLAVTGASLDSAVLVDHHAIEARYARQLEMLHAYDAPAVNDTALLDWLEENNGRLQFEAEDEATPPHAVVYLPSLENGESCGREAGRGDDFRAAIADAMSKGEEGER